MKAHFVGVGGIGMSAIAKILLQKGWQVSGSDLNENQNVVNLKKIGLNFFLGHRSSNVDNKLDFLIHTSAVKNDNPELEKAKHLGITILKRAQMLSKIYEGENKISVAGSHGKTTTSCYLSEMLMNLKIKPRFIVGGVLKKVDSNSDIGDGKFCVIEADESDSSFMYLHSDIGILTNIDDDHLDFYNGREGLIKQFSLYTQNNCKKLVINKDDHWCQGLITNDSITYSSLDPKCDYFFSIRTMSFGKTQFDLTLEDKKYEVNTNITGHYNISNLVSAIAALVESGIEMTRIIDSVKSIEGIKRRYDLLHKSENFVVIDDYAHHPSEIKSFISSAKNEYDGLKTIVYFEPHRFTRTQNFWNEFTRCFSGVDEFYLLPIYPASEKAIEGVSSKRLFDEIKLDEKYYLESFSELRSNLQSRSRSNVLWLCIGAGPMSQIFREEFNAQSL